MIMSKFLFSSLRVLACLCGVSMLAACAEESAPVGSSKAARAMARLDTNGDGYVTQSEAQSEPRLAQHFARVDTNGDGRISATEADLALQRRGSRQSGVAGGQAIQTSATSTSTGSGGSGRVQQAFANLDTNSNGVITRDEATGRFADVFDKVDQNRDSFVTMDEVNAAMAQRSQRRASRDTGSGSAPSSSSSSSYASSGSSVPASDPTTPVYLDPGASDSIEPLPGDFDPTYTEPNPDVRLETDDEGFLIPVVD